MNRLLNGRQLATATCDDPRWAVITARDPSADGQFFYSVSTTGVYCRPSCAARRPRPEHVSFYTTSAAAERAGFRPCKRCQPHQAGLATQQLAKITAACRTIEQSETPPILAALATEAGLSPYHFHRLFKSITGLTPRAYATAHRAKQIRQQLRQADTVTTAICEAGYNSSSRFYEASNAILGMTPSAYRDGGMNTVIHFATGACSLGWILVARSQRGICAILLGDAPAPLVSELQSSFPKAQFVNDAPEFADLLVRVIAFIEEPALGLALPLDVRGTVFQQRVWQVLQRIPPGKTLSYTEIAKQIGKPKAIRAVASACAANRLAVAIPCHRAVRHDGTLTGYRWGVERKRALLAKETAG